MCYVRSTHRADGVVATFARNGLKCCRVGRNNTFEVIKSQVAAHFKIKFWLKIIYLIKKGFASDYF